MKYFKLRSKNLKEDRLEVIKPFLDLGLISENVILSGGSLRTLVQKNENSVNDFDIFFKELEYVFVIRKELEQRGAKLIFECPEGKLFTYNLQIARTTYKVQLICEFDYKDPFTLISSFDIDAGAAAYDGTYLYFFDSFLRSNRKKEIGLIKLSYPLATIKRIYKYKEKGFGINKILKQFIDRILFFGKEDYSFGQDGFRLYID